MLKTAWEEFPSKGWRKLLYQRIQAGCLEGSLDVSTAYVGNPQRMVWGVGVATWSSLPTRRWMSG